jgi:CubicO group peptidase (beta-lactamase class C family)
MADSPLDLRHLHTAMAARVERGELPGLVTLVAHDADVYVDAIGTRAFDSSEPMRRDTPFRVTSMTKPILAATTMMQVEDRVLALDQPVDHWLPELADRRVLKRIDGPLDETVPAHRPIVVDDLLTQRMGFGLLVEPTFDPPFPIVNAGHELGLALGAPDPPTQHNPDEWIKLFGRLPLMAQPGERWMYNVSSLVLGVLLARADGQSLGDVLQARVFEPLGMRSTGFWLPAERARELPSYYAGVSETGQPTLCDVSTPDQWSRHPIFPSGSGGLASTADDMLRFGRMLLDAGTVDGKRLLSAESVTAMTTNHLTPEQIAGGGPLLGGVGYGYGVGVIQQPDAEWPVPGRYGWTGGYGTSWFNDPHRRIVAVAMTQVSDFLWNGGNAEFERLVGAG